MKIQDMSLDKLRSVLKEYEDNRLSAISQREFDAAKKYAKRANEIMDEIKSRK